MQIKHELGLAESTGVDWDSFCREVCEITFLENSERRGGEGKIVQINESKFGKRKYHRGHHGEDPNGYSGEFRNNHCIRLLERIYYCNFEKYGYEHRTVNHSIEL